MTRPLSSIAVILLLWAYPALAADATKPVIVFILAGQSHMEG